MVTAAAMPPAVTCHQNSYRAILDSHTGALKAIRNFWRQLCRRDVKFAGELCSLRPARLSRLEHL